MCVFVTKPEVGGTKSNLQLKHAFWLVRLVVKWCFFYTFFQIYQHIYLQAEKNEDCEIGRSREWCALLPGSKFRLLASDWVIVTTCSSFSWLVWAVGWVIGTLILLIVRRLNWGTCIKRKIVKMKMFHLIQVIVNDWIMTIVWSDSNVNFNIFFLWIMTVVKKCA